jgi:hypothetical protein
MKIPLKQAFKKHLERRYSLRLHMFIILLTTTLSGIFFSKLTLLLGVVEFWIRYPLVVALSYLIFFVCIRLWLSCVSSFRQSKTSAVDWIDIPGNSFAGDIKNPLTSFHGGGGEFGGAGASDSFDGTANSFVETTALPKSPASIGGGVRQGNGDSVLGVADALVDDGIIIAVIALVLLVSTILVSSVILLYSAPAILAEATFEGILAVSLIRRTRTISEKAWVGSVLKATWKPFVVMLHVAFFAGGVLHIYYPNAVRLADILLRNQ